MSFVIEGWETGQRQFKRFPYCSRFSGANRPRIPYLVTEIVKQASKRFLCEFPVDWSMIPVTLVKKNYLNKNIF
jgi:hypothetical protein